MSLHPGKLVLRPILAAGLLFGMLSSAGAEAPRESISLRKGDALLVRIEGLSGNLPEYREIVDSDGRIELPFLGFMDAADKTIAQVEAEMAAAYVDARLASNITARIQVVTHFDPPPDRANLVRHQDPRQPVPAAEALPAADTPAPE